MAKITVDAYMSAIKDSSGNMSLIAMRLNVSRKSLYKWLEKRPKLDELRREHKEEFKDYARKKLEDHIARGSEKSLHFFLKTQCEEYRKDSKGSDNPRINIIVNNPEEQEAINRALENDQ